MMKTQREMQDGMVGHEQSVAHAADQNLLSFLQHQATWTAGGRCTFGSGVFSAAGATSYPCAPFSVAYRVGTTPAEVAVDAAIERFAALRRGFSLYVRTGVDADMERECRARGFLECGIMPVMALDCADVENGRVSGIRLDPVESPQRVAEFAEIASRAYLTADVPASVVKEAFNSPHDVLQSPARLYIASHHDEVVGCGLLLPAANVVGIYWVSVLPQHRCRGYATAMTQRLVQIAKASGMQTVVLQALSPADRIYRSLHFREIGQLRSYCYLWRRHSRLQSVLAAQTRQETSTDCGRSETIVQGL